MSVEEECSTILEKNGACMLFESSHEFLCLIFVFSAFNVNLELIPFFSKCHVYITNLIFVYKIYTARASFSNF